MLNYLILKIIRRERAFLIEKNGTLVIPIWYQIYVYVIKCFQYYIKIYLYDQSESYKPFDFGLKVIRKEDRF